MKISAVSFCGIAKPFIDGSGNRIIPIAQKPDESMIKAAQEAAKGAPFAQGCNGEAFYLGEDLIVKRHKGKNAYIKDNKREIAMLDKMYDAKVRLPNSQTGMFAIESPETTYLVSTKVKGDIIHPVKNPYNREKFASLLDAMAQMDKGFYLENSSKTGGSNKCRFMNYDFNMGNVLFDGNQASMREKAHSEVLQPGKNGKIPSDIMYSEIMKMQTSRFIHKSSSHTREGQINQTQIKNYTDNALKYFNKMLEQSVNNKDENRIIYYKDAVSLMNDWKKINDSIADKKGKKIQRQIYR